MKTLVPAIAAGARFEHLRLHRGDGS
jgi:hypothetical protein